MRQPGIWSLFVRREKQEGTRFPGVKVLGNGEYRVRGKRTDQKTGLIRELDRVISEDGKGRPLKSAQEAFNERQRLLAEQHESAPTRIRLRDFALGWQDEKEKELKASTLERYATAIDLHIVPMLGDHFLDSLTHRDIVAWRNQLEGEPSTINSWLRILKGICSSATAELRLKQNPAEHVKAVRELPKDDEDEGSLLTAHELGVFLEHARTVAPAWFPLIHVLSLTAMRIGEATALRWTDIDETHGVIRVKRGQHRGTLDSTKTSTKRSVPLPDALAITLRDHRRQLVAKQHPGVDSGWVFPAYRRRLKHPDGYWPPTSTSSLRKPLLEVLAAVDLEGRITTHGLRRTWNNLLRQVSAGDVVRSITGHVTERMTEHYSHVGRNEKAQAATRALSLVRGDRLEVGTLVGTEVATSV